MEKIRRTVIIPKFMYKQIKEVANATNNSVNSVILMSCIEYVSKFNEDFGELIKEQKKK
ncbi:hypothetical protein AB0X60_05440 [Ligilactobacillus salivarius]|jgi:hypothetical protein|uniref:hypothetical protein n=1 Tax=Ligilactobacillus salivarius TaxID=1624 RepID=UPI003F21C2B1